MNACATGSPAFLLGFPLQPKPGLNGPPAETQDPSTPLGFASAPLGMTERKGSPLLLAANFKPHSLCSGRRG